MTAAPVEPAGRAGPEAIDRVGIRWGRAVLSGLALVVMGFLVCAYLPDVILKHANMGRDERANLAAGISLVGVVAMAWLVRRLQRRGLI
jgi:hypothetical protein